VSLTLTAEASRVVLVDLPGNLYSDRGQDWVGDVDFPGASSGTIPFALNFGSGAALQSFTFSPFGQILFSGTNFVAPFLSAAPFQATGDNSSFMRFGSGRVDPTLLDNVLPDPDPGTFDESNALAAFRFTWFNVCLVCDGSDDRTFQVVFVDRKNGDFDLDFNYFAPGLPASGQRGFELDANVLSLTAGPFGYPGPDYCFRDGVGSLCSSVAAVPEPETLALVLGGLALLGLRSRRRNATGIEST
jgi:hypothetical protein